MENEVIDNTVTENVDNTNTENEVNENTINEDLAVDTLASTLDYYDRYYEQMLNKADNIISNQEIIIDNQYEEIEQNERLQQGIDVIVFLIGVYVIYQFLRNMIIVK